MAFLKRLLCCGSASKVKYEGEPQRRTKAKRCVPCRGLKSKSKTAPTSGAEDCDSSSSSPSSSSSSESPRSVLATIVLEENQSQDTNASQSYHKHSKSYSSVSSVGRKLVENLADEVVEDFIASKLMPPPPAAAAIPSPVQDAPRPSGAIPPTVPDQEDVLSRDPEKSSAEVAVRGLPNKGVTQADVDDLIDSAFEARDNNFKEKRAYFEERSRAEIEEKVERIKSTAQMKPTLESQHQKGDGHGSTDMSGGVGMPEQWSQPAPLRTSEPSGEVIFSTNKSLSRVNSGRSWILELNDTGQAFASATPLEDAAYEDEVPVNNGGDNPPFFSGACVVRRVFRAESLAEEGSESSDGSVISVEINSGPRDANDDGHSSEHALEWYFSMTRKKANDRMTTDHRQ